MSSPPADLVLTDARLPGTGADTVVLRAGRVAAVGRWDDVATAGLPVRSAGGRLVLPGFWDAHVHPVAGGLLGLWCDLQVDPDLDRARARLAAHPADPDGWVRAGGLAPELVASGAEVLAAVSGAPALVLDADLHGGWANDAALAVAGVDRSAPDPPGGRFGRAADGGLSGRLDEAAVEVVARAAPPPSPATLAAALRRAHARLHAVGVVGYQDAMVGPGLGLPDALPGHLALAGESSATVTLVLRWDPDRGLEQLPELRERRAAATAAGLTADRVKVFADGVVENGTAALLGGTGGERYAPGELAEIVSALHADGVGAHLHAIGDRAVRDCLDAVATALQRHGPRGPGHQVAHLQLVDPADRPRFAALGVTAVVQPLWACDTRVERQLVEPVLGAAAYAAQYPYGSLVAAGAELALGSDWPVTDPAPLRGMSVGRTRLPCLPAAPGLQAADVVGPLGPEEALPLATLLAAYTRGSARACGHPDAGTLAPGARADLVVLDRDVTADPDALAEARVDLTVAAGRLVHDRHDEWA